MGGRRERDLRSGPSKLRRVLEFCRLCKDIGRELSAAEMGKQGSPVHLPRFWWRLGVGSWRPNPLLAQVGAVTELFCLHRLEQPPRECSAIQRSLECTPHFLGSILCYPCITCNTSHVVIVGNFHYPLHVRLKVSLHFSSSTKGP